MNPVFLDFETQCDVDISKSSRRQFADRARALTCVLKVDGVYHVFGRKLDADTMYRYPNTVEHGGPYLDAAAKQTLERLTLNRVIVAHNAPFDSSIWERSEGMAKRQWYDTIPPARAAGLPGGLDKLGVLIAGRGKDPNGKRLIDMFCILKPGQRSPALDNPAVTMLTAYNVRDVELLEQIYERVKGYGEPDVIAVDRTINERGVPVNAEFLRTLDALFVENKKRGDKTFDEVYEVNPRSQKQMHEWCRRHGFQFDGFNKVAMREFSENPEEAFIGEDSNYADALSVMQEVLMLRKEVVSVGSGKAKSAINVLDDDDRLRDQFVIYGAGPGRWAGRQFQMHNLPSILSRSCDFRSVEMTMDGIAAVARDIEVPVADVLSGMLRHVVQCEMSVADYAQVEARCVAWLADEHRMLDIFADVHRSIYIDMGEKLYGRTLSKKNDMYEYTLCKALVLGCTYGMSGSKFNYTCNVRGEHKALDTMLKMGMTADDAVKLYRKSYPCIPELWKKYGDAAMLAVQGISTETGRCHFHMSGPDLHIVLPSGRPIVYRNAHIAMMVPAYCKMYGMPEEPIPTVVYDTMRGTRGFLYGSKVCENVSQGTCRDLLAWALVHMEQDGCQPFLHVHDEGGGATARIERVCEIMSEQPRWAKGFPIMVEGYQGPIWTKNTKGYKECTALNGKVLK